MGRDLVQIQVVDGRQVTDTDRAARGLREEVRKRVNNEVSRRRLEHPEPIKVRWSPSGRPVQSSAEVLGTEGLSRQGDVTQVPDFFRSLPRRQLVVLGAPGAGKSVLALLLARELLASWEDGEPVPVLLSLSSWRPAVSLRRWMARRLRALSPDLDKVTAQRLVDEGKVMPVLDGLDELPAALHARAVKEIETAVAEDVPLLVTCRAAEYETTVEATGDYLTRAAVVELESVKPEAAITYLEHSKVPEDRRWDGVFKALRRTPKSPVAAALSSPLMLDLARTAYRAGSTDPGELLRGKRFGKRRDIESHLLERYLPTVYAESADTRYKSEQARRYLELIARRMRRDGTSDFAWWQIDSLITGPLVGTAYGCVWGWFFSLLFGPGVGVVAGVLSGGCGYVAYAGVRSGRKQVYIAKDALHGPRATLLRYGLLGVLSALVVACVVGVVVGCWLRSAVHVPAGTAWEYGLLVGGGLGSATLLGSAWGAYQLSRAWFGLTKRLPPRLMRFLDDAHELGVLRQTGAVYQFRHARLQEQLSGGGRPPKGSVLEVEWDARWNWKPLLPFVPAASQFGFALMGLIIVGLVSYMASSGVGLDHRSGAKPDISVSAQCNNDTTGQTCYSLRTLSWTVPAGSSVATELGASARRSVSVLGLGGGMEARGCAKASVEVGVRLKGRDGRPVVVRVGQRSPSEKARALPGALRFQGELPVSVTLRRLDREPCDVQFAWTEPELTADIYAYARARFGVAG
ncbi:NACHT domain-containing protein [Streptomyces sp. SCA3-4]|uniref:NACHT domain-containing protein n=1 Tax=Streptomyces sichuanensis TaxID=2871810 RepID=UPI001CE36530|nr:NACHT domain-containing protein [Streptomyces sichuanensis]MCA6094779.1 NACHT domain-containing protein [Streptomyces sichuanensis]